MQRLESFTLHFNYFMKKKKKNEKGLINFK